MAPPGPAVQGSHDDLLSLVARARIEIVPNRHGAPKAVRTAPGGP